MIAIKGMDMPKNAKTCRFRHSIFNYCVIDKNRDTIKTDKFDKCLNCPLIDLPEDKDMSEKEIIECLAQAYCFKENELKPLDADLIKSMAQNILKLQNKKALIGDER